MNSNNVDVNNICLICGDDFKMPVRNGFGTGSHDICACCGAETGLDDADLESIRAWRTKWLGKGGKRLIPIRDKPWSREEQMKNIPPEFL